MHSTCKDWGGIREVWNWGKQDRAPGLITGILESLQHGQISPTISVAESEQGAGGESRK